MFSTDSGTPVGNNNSRENDGRHVATTGTPTVSVDTTLVNDSGEEIWSESLPEMADKHNIAAEIIQVSYPVPHETSVYLTELRPPACSNTSCRRLRYCPLRPCCDTPHSRRFDSVSNPPDDALLTELATYQNRKLLLWQLAADGRSFCGIQFMARERDLQGAPVDEQVRASIRTTLGRRESTRVRRDGGLGSPESNQGSAASPLDGFCLRAILCRSRRRFPVFWVPNHRLSRSA